MRLIEFQADIKNGMIEIPQQYLQQLQTSVKVLILQDKSTIKSVLNKKEKFLSKVAKHRFDLPLNYHFNREELYDRS
ncbi:MAG: hypothetical protein HQK70_08515 [Desulfamplus sp.]|nr:hypothetical protein [Desulfamplus sp.]